MINIQEFTERSNTCAALKPELCKCMVLKQTHYPNMLVLCTCVRGSIVHIVKSPPDGPMTCALNLHLNNETLQRLTVVLKQTQRSTKYFAS